MMKCVTGFNPYGHCGSAACCGTGHKCCVSCSEDCNIRCGWVDKMFDSLTANESSGEICRNSVQEIATGLRPSQ